jgi:hypothetical protein
MLNLATDGFLRKSGRPALSLATLGFIFGNVFTIAVDTLTLSFTEPQVVLNFSSDPILLSFTEKQVTIDIGVAEPTLIVLTENEIRI